MALLDHFRPPLSVRRHWHAFHNAWATYIAADLNQHLPSGYFAESNVQFGVEIDIAAFEESLAFSLQHASSQDVVSAGAAPLDTTWTPPLPTQTIPFSMITDTVEVRLFHNEAGPVLVGAIELVSPANKDRLAHRKAFVAKCETYLQQGVGLVVVDVVTGRRANLHDALLEHLGTSEVAPFGAVLYAIAYRLIQRDGQPRLDIWQEPLTLGQPLPTLPLWLPGDLCLPVLLEATYERTCREQRLMTDSC